MFLIAFIGLTLPVSVVALGIEAGYCVWLMLKGFPVGWGVAMTLFCLFCMVSAFRVMSTLQQLGGAKNNAAAASCLVPLLEVAFVAYFVTSPLPYEISQWWALLLPLIFVLFLLLQWGLEYVLDAVHSAGRR